MHCTSVTASGDSRSTSLRAAHRHGHTGAADALDDPGKLAAVAGEQDQFIAAAHTQHLGQMSGGNGGQLEDAARTQGGVHVDPGQPHGLEPV